MIEGKDLNLVLTFSLCRMLVEGNLERKENQMHLELSESELSELEASDEGMGGDLNRIEPPKMEDYSKHMATWIMLKEGGFIPFMEAIEGHEKNCSLQFVNGWSDIMVTINRITFQVNE